MCASTAPTLTTGTCTSTCVKQSLTPSEQRRLLRDTLDVVAREEGSEVRRT